MARSAYVLNGCILGPPALHSDRPSTNLLKCVPELSLGGELCFMVPTHAVHQIANTRTRYSVKPRVCFGTVAKRETYVLVVISERFRNHGGNTICHMGVKTLAAWKQ